MLRPGLKLGDRYRLDTRIGAGGMGEVWRAVDDVLGRVVAVKAMLPEVADDPDFARRFLVEAKAMASVNHRAVASIHDYGRSHGLTFLVMEFIDGQSLSQLLTRHGRLSPADTMHLVAQAADGLQAVHDRGIVHRDIKPANLLVRPDGSLLITDFGISRHRDATQLTTAGAVLGTPTYLSPEQVLGQPATARSDVYALGLVAYECLTGRRPFTGDNPYAVALQRVQVPPPALGDDVPQPVRAVVAQALAAEPADRWPSAAALAAAARWSGPGGHVPPPRPAPPAPGPSPLSGPPPVTGPAPDPLPPSAGSAPRPRRTGPAVRRWVPVAATVALLLGGGTVAWQTFGDDRGGRADAAPTATGPVGPGTTGPATPAGSGGPSGPAGSDGPAAPVGFAACGDALCPTTPRCWGGLVTIGGNAMPARELDCAAPHAWETFAAIPRPPDAEELRQDELLAHHEIEDACSASAMVARGVDRDAVREWTRDAWPVRIPDTDDWLVHCLARSRTGDSTGAAFRPA